MTAAELDSDEQRLVNGLVAHFAAAFNELHAKTVEAMRANRRFSRHYDYPKQSDNGEFPFFRGARFFDETAPPDYVGTVRPVGLLGALMKTAPVTGAFPEIDRLKQYISDHGLAERIVSGSYGCNFRLDEMINQCVERYVHMYGSEPIEDEKRNRILAALIRAMFWDELPMSIVAPVTLTHFEIDHFRLNETTYITKIPKGIQIARSRIAGHGSGVVDTVAGAATHCFVSTGWSIPRAATQEVKGSLETTSPDVIAAIENFLACIRLTTGFPAGLAQVIAFPKQWALGYFCELPSLYGYNCRRYPSYYDNYGWAPGKAPRVTREHMKEIKRLYSLLLVRNEQQIAIAVSRLNSCMLRDDDVDAILDAVIGLEVLLGDDDKQSLSYKLRMRAAALLSFAGVRPADQVLKSVTAIYERRSAIVHGTKKRPSKSVTTDPARPFARDRDEAASMLRDVLKVLLEHPKFLNPPVIDRELMLGMGKSTGCEGQ